MGPKPQQFQRASISALSSPLTAEYFQPPGCVLGPAPAVVMFCTGRDADVYGLSELQAPQMGNRS